MMGLKILTLPGKEFQGHPRRKQVPCCIHLTVQFGWITGVFVKEWPG